MQSLHQLHLANERRLKLQRRPAADTVEVVTAGGEVRGPLSGYCGKAAGVDKESPATGACRGTFGRWYADFTSATLETTETT